MRALAERIFYGSAWPPHSTQADQLDTVTRSPWHQGHGVALGVNRACVLLIDKIPVLYSLAAGFSSRADVA